VFSSALQEYLFLSLSFDFVLLYDVRLHCSYDARYDRRVVSFVCLALIWRTINLAGCDVRRPNNSPSLSKALYEQRVIHAQSVLESLLLHLHLTAINNEILYTMESR
jgi:hypothetical protein